MCGCDPMDDAASWFIELITASDVNKLWLEFEAWLELSSRNRSAYEQIERAWSQFDYRDVLRSYERLKSGEVTLLH